MRSVQMGRVANCSTRSVQGVFAMPKGVRAGQEATEEISAEPGGGQGDQCRPLPT